MELRELGFFVALGEELHFRRAATRLGMTQPPLSRAIAKLEAEFGAELIARRDRLNLRLTPAGAALLEEGKRLLAQGGTRPAGQTRGGRRNRPTAHRLRSLERDARTAASDGRVSAALARR